MNEMPQYPTARWLTRLSCIVVGMLLGGCSCDKPIAPEPMDAAPQTAAEAAEESQPQPEESAEHDTSPAESSASTTEDRPREESTTASEQGADGSASKSPQANRGSGSSGSSASGGKAAGQGARDSAVRDNPGGQPIANTASGAASTKVAPGGAGPKTASDEASLRKAKDLYAKAQAAAADNAGTAYQHALEAWQTLRPHQDHPPSRVLSEQIFADLKRYGERASSSSGAAARANRKPLRVD